MFWNNFVSLCNEKGVSPNGVCAQLGFSNATATKWKSGSVPRGATLRKLADYFGVTPEYLLTGKEKAQPQGVKLDESDSEFLSEVAKQLKEMTEDEKRELQNYVEFLKSRRKNG